MNRKINYGRFPRLRAVVGNCDLEIQEEQENLFRALVKCLVRKRVCNTDGIPLQDREGSFEYLLHVLPSLTQEDLDSLTENADEFYQRFIFFPCEKTKSLYSEFQNLGIESTFKGVPVSEIFKEYHQETGYSPYEKVSKEELRSFMNYVRSVCVLT